MVIGNFDVKRVGVNPTETDSPLIVDANAVLTLSIAAQRFEPVAGYGPQVGQRSRRLQLVELALGYRRNAL